MSITNKSTSIAIVLIIVAALLIISRIGFFFHGKNTVSSFRNNSTMISPNYHHMGQFKYSRYDLEKNRGRTPGFRRIVGEVVSLDGDSLVIKMTNGDSRTFTLSDQTIINQSIVATKDDLVVGSTISIAGGQNIDLSNPVENIEINPNFTQ